MKKKTSLISDLTVVQPLDAKKGFMPMKRNNSRKPAIEMAPQNSLADFFRKGGAGDMQGPTQGLKQDDSGDDSPQSPTFLVSKFGMNREVSLGAPNPVNLRLANQGDSLIQTWPRGAKMSAMTKKKTEPAQVDQKKTKLEDINLDSEEENLCDFRGLSRNANMFGDTSMQMVKNPSGAVAGTQMARRTSQRLRASRNPSINFNNAFSYNEPPMQMTDEMNFMPRQDSFRASPTRESTSFKKATLNDYQARPSLPYLIPITKDQE